MPFLPNLNNFLQGSPSTDEQRLYVEVADKMLAGAAQAAKKVFEGAHKMEGLWGMPRDSVASAILASGQWRAWLPPRDGKSLSLARDILIAKNQFPSVRAHPTHVEVDPEALGEAIGQVAKLARKLLVAQVLRVLVPEATALRVPPRDLAGGLTDHISQSPQMFREGDLAYRLIELLQ